MGRFLKQSWLVLTAALVFGLLVALVHGQLKPIIEANAKEKLEREMKALLTEAVSFDAIPDSEGKSVLYYIGKGAEGGITGYAIEAVGGGFADKIKLLVTTDSKCEKLRGIAVLKSNETPGFGDKIKDARFKDQYVGCPAVKLVVTKSGSRSIVDDKIVSITGATVSSEAVTRIVNEAVESLRQLQAAPEN